MAAIRSRERDRRADEICEHHRDGFRLRDLRFWLRLPLADSIGSKGFEVNGRTGAATYWPR